MIARYLSTAACIAILLNTLACRSDADPTQRSDQKANADDTTSTDIETTRRSAILKAAQEYKGYPQASDILAFAPMDCASPQPSSMMPQPPAFSASDDEATHGRKLYHLYVSDINAYLSCNIDGVQQSVGQTLVKESWQAAPMQPDYFPRPMSAEYEEPTPDADGKMYIRGKQGPLFIMQYLGEDAAETDEGWIYATLTPEGETITGMGMMKSCIKCHEDAPNHRLFGLIPTALRP